MPFIFPTLLVAVGLGIVVLVALPIILEALEDRKEGQEQEMRERVLVRADSIRENVNGFSSARESGSSGSIGGLRRRMTDDTITKSTILNPPNHFSTLEPQSNPFEDDTNSNSNSELLHNSQSEFDSPSITPTVRSRASSCSTEELLSPDGSGWNFIQGRNISQEYILDGGSTEGSIGEIL